MGWNGATGRGSDRGEDVLASRGTARNLPFSVQFDVAAASSASAFQVIQGHRIVVLLLILQRPGVDGAFDLAQVGDAGLCLRGITSFHEVRDRDRSQQADNGHYDHDFHQRERSLLGR